MFKLIPTLTPLFFISLSACKKVSQQNETVVSENQAEDNVEVRIELVPEIKPGEENLSEEERMMKRYNETKTVITPSKEALEQMNDPANWKEVTQEDLKLLGIQNETDTMKQLKKITEESHNNTKKHKKENNRK